MMFASRHSERSEESTGLNKDANMMFASTLFPQTEISPFEDVQKTLNVFQEAAFTSPVRGSQHSPLNLWERDVFYVPPHSVGEVRWGGEREGLLIIVILNPSAIQG